MSCYICRRSTCAPSFHPLEEQVCFEKAEAAYEKYLEVLEKCREALTQLQAMSEVK